MNSSRKPILILLFLLCASFYPIMAQDAVPTEEVTAQETVEPQEITVVPADSTAVPTDEPVATVTDAGFDTPTDEPVEVLTETPSGFVTPTLAILTETPGDFITPTPVETQVPPIPTETGDGGGDTGGDGSGDTTSSNAVYIIAIVAVLAIVVGMFVDKWANYKLSKAGLGMLPPEFGPAIVSFVEAGTVKALEAGKNSAEKTVGEFDDNLIDEGARFLNYEFYEVSPGIWKARKKPPTTPAAPRFEADNG